MSGLHEAPPTLQAPWAVQASFAGVSTTIEGSPTTQEVRKNSSYLQVGQLPIGPTPRRLATISEAMPPEP